MKIRFNFFFVLFILCTLSSCSSLGALKFWEDDSEIELPSELFDFQESVELDLKWMNMKHIQLKNLKNSWKE